MAIKKREGTLVSVSYLDAVKGGSGCTNLYLDELPGWLKERPGTLIREIDVRYTVRTDPVTQEQYIDRNTIFGTVTSLVKPEDQHAG